MVVLLRRRATLLVSVVIASLLLSEGVGVTRHKKAHLVDRLMQKMKRRDGAVRLVDGHSSKQGNVEVWHKGRWGAVCDDEWDLREAAVVCRELGFDSVDRVTHSSKYGRARRKFWMDNLYCTGDEATLALCRFDGWGESDCDVTEAAGVVCEASDPSTTAAPPPISRPKTLIKHGSRGLVSVRLRGGRVPVEGRVEVRFEGSQAWGLVCGDGWGLLEAAVVCRQLRLGYADTATQTDFFGAHSAGTQVTLSGVQCRGNETDMSLCLHDDVDHVTCAGSSAGVAAVICVKHQADLVIDHDVITRSAQLQDREMFYLQCAMEENCLASQAYKARDIAPGSWHLEARRLLRFTANIANIGTAAFRPLAPKNRWEFHQCHMHYHSMEVFATFDVLDSAGVKVAEGHKASFCLEDNQCMSGVQPVFACANFGDQGISVNCTDIYRNNIDCQWVDITELPPGTYTFKVSINSEFKVGEMSFENNAAVCTMVYNEVFVHIANCTLQRP